MALMLTKKELPRGLAKDLPGVELFQLGRCMVMVAREPVDKAYGNDLRWHLSISHPSRFPTWEEIGEARDRLLPAGVWLCMPHPPREYWLSVHPNCFHLWEIRDENLVAQWKHEGEHARSLGVGSPQPEYRETGA